jgi:predicted membrane protein
MMPDRSAAGRSGGPKTAQLIIGLSVVALGVLFTLDNLHVLTAREYLRFWPLAVIAVGTVNALSAQDTSARVFGGFVAFAGAWMLLGSLGIVHVRFWDFWPLVLIFFGGTLVWRGWQGGSYTERRPPATDASSLFNAVALMGGFDRVVTADPFRGGEVTALMGGGKIDLTRARIAAGSSASVHVLAMMGGMEIRVPEDWTVENRVVYFMGGAEDRTRVPAGTSTDAPRLVLTGFVMMGGVEIKN